MTPGPVLVTGASGFVGACLVRRLLDEGAEVHVLLRRPEQSWRLEDVRGRLHVHPADLLDAERVRAALAEARPRVVHHLAAHGAYESQSDARAILRTNVLGTLNLLDAARDAGVGLFVSTGSSSEYGWKSAPMAESDRLEPNSYYAVAKSAQTHLCLLPCYQKAMTVVVFRLFSVYGPWEEPTRLMPTLVRRARAGLPLEMVSPETARDFVYVDDVLEALTAWDRLGRLGGEVLNLGSGVETKLKEVVEVVREVLSSESEVRWGSMRARHWDSTRWVADPAKARRLLGWEARVTLRNGLARLAAWMEKRGNGHGTEGGGGAGDGVGHPPVGDRAVA